MSKRAMTIDERIAREDAKREAMTINELLGESKKFTCCQCGKVVELGLSQDYESWAYNVSYKHKYAARLCCCSWNCLQAYRREHASESRRCRPYTAEEDEEIVRLRKAGLTWPEIGEKVHREAMAARARYQNFLTAGGDE